MDAPMSQGTIAVDLPTFKALRKAYNKALDGGRKGQDAFVFRGSELVVDYAYYLLVWMRGGGGTTSREIRDYVGKKDNYKIRRAS